MALLSKLVGVELRASVQMRTLGWMGRLVMLYNTWLVCGEVPCREPRYPGGIDRTSLAKLLEGWWLR